MSSSEQHQMEYLKTRPSGDEEWRCAICGRHLLIQWGEENRRIILAPGNTRVTHVGSKNGQPPRPKSVSDRKPPAARPAAAEEEPILSPELRAALEELDFGDWPELPR